MASIVTFCDDRRIPIIRFPEGSASELSGYWGSGPVRLFRSDEVPDTAHLLSGHKMLQDFVPINAKLAMTEEIKDLIEELEPGIHQFFPVKIKRAKGSAHIFHPNGAELTDPYFLFNCGIKIDAVLIDKSEVRVTDIGVGGPPMVHPIYGKEGRIVLSREMVKGHHVWRGNLQLGRITLFSDALTDIVKGKGWSGLRFTCVQED